ncbi:uncharacterized protein BJ212DRAFT_1439115 [Suillus subaureus]|uniref:G domain-containing protein n=1 Tax=Suillus subaureus TaxID=48587 RepID=A0A9P7J4B2_9AGAM|nr:uncharacterized protein BJ212DRAFT_1439115 [Suillus subaureus]KAG1802458.1 hypothetical protein BJ212DRAFT_1439115 [Suillus subaureus]
MPESTIRTIPPEIARSTILPPKVAAGTEHGTTSMSSDFTRLHSTIRTITPEIAESTILPPTMATRIKRDTTSTSSNTPVLLPDYSPGRLRPLPMSAKNIVIFGESGVGKSSIINLLAGQQVVRTSVDVKHGTLRYEAYNVNIEAMPYRIYETAGVDGNRMDPGGFRDAVTNADNLKKELKVNGGIHLLLYCIKADRIPLTFVTNYRPFYEFLFEEKVPVALIVTHMEREDPMDDWYTRNKGSFDRHAVNCVDHACITAAANLDPKYKKKYDASKKEVSDLIIRNKDTVVDWNGGDGWLARFIGKLKDISTGRPSKSDVLGVLMKRGGLEDNLAKDVIQKLSR